MAVFEIDFEAENPGVDVRVSIAGSNTLRRQILDGAPVDVFAVADVAFLGDVPGADPQVLAMNQLTLVLAPDSSVDSLDQLDSVAVARCASGVPCGDATSEFLDQSGTNLGLVTQEQNVRAVLNKVTRGEVDAGFVYKTEAKASGLAELPLANAPTVEVGVTALGDSQTGRDFVAFLSSDAAADQLSDLGFLGVGS